MLLVKRELWEDVINSHREFIEARAGYAAGARKLAKTLRSGDQLPAAELDGLIAHLTEVIDDRERALATLRMLRAIPQPAPLPANLQLHASLDDAPVIASKQVFDNIGALTETAFEMAEELADRLTELVTAVETGGWPNRERLAELDDALNDTKEALVDQRAIFRRSIGRLEWMPTEA